MLELFIEKVKLLELFIEIVKLQFSCWSFLFKK